MNKKILEAIGSFVDQNYLSAYTIEGYFGFAYLKVISREGDEIVWHCYPDKNNDIVIEIKDNIII